MDQLDYKILEILKENGRETASTISKKVHLSVSAVLDRIKKLEENQIIQYYTIIINEKAIGNEMTAVMEVSLEHPKFQDGFIEEICRNPNVIACYSLTGDFDFLLKICSSSADHMEKIYREIKGIPGVWNTRTHFILKEIKNIYTAVPSEQNEKK